MPINVDYLRVELKSGGVRLPRVQMRDRRAAGEPEIYWIFQRHLERVLYDRSEGGTSGAIWTLLNETGMGQTAGVQVAALAKRDQTLDNRPQLFRLRQGGHDLLMLDQCLCHVPEKHISVL